MTDFRAWTILVLEDPEKENVLLLKRASSKPFYKGLMTGIGGGIELLLGEAGDVEKSALRELEEETVIRQDDVTNIKMRLVTIVTEDARTRLLFWMTGSLTKLPSSLECNEGTLDWFPKNDLPLEGMTPTAKHAIPFALGLSEDDQRIYDGAFKPLGNGELELHIAD